LANVAFAIVRVNVYWGVLRKSYVEQAIGDEWDVKDLIGGTEEYAANLGLTSFPPSHPSNHLSD
jgi:hypothetical protein